MKKAILLILDGVGVRNSSDNNAVNLAYTPNLNRYKDEYIYTQLNASESFVGLPSGVFGNSEVGHLNIGAGRIVNQVINTIDNDILSKEFFLKSQFLEALSNCKGRQCHIMGLLSDGAVHAMNTHYYALLDMASKYAVESSNIDYVWLHLFLDGRDTPPNTGLVFIQQLEGFVANLSLQQKEKIKIATVSGRYYAMDRDKRYERTKLAYSAIAEAKSSDLSNEISGGKHLEALQYVKNCYEKGIFDEFIPPYVCLNNNVPDEIYKGMHSEDVIFFTNFRADRAIQLTTALAQKEFKGFNRKDITLNIVTMTQYQPDLLVKVAYEKPIIVNTLGECISRAGGKQLRVAETEKYPHVTYFFSGGIDETYPNEDRIFVASPKEVTSYDHKPEMSLPELATKLIDAINNNDYQLIVANFANGDMVGHTGILSAAIKAVEFLDKYVALVVEAALAQGFHIIITADHGNCEEMYDEGNHVPHTQHTTNLVPFIYISNTYKKYHLLCREYDESTDGACGSLRDIAPTILHLLEIAIPKEMTGKSLLVFN